MSEVLADPPSSNTTPAKEGFVWSPLKVVALVLAALAVLIFGAIYLRYASTHEETDDAYTQGRVHNISSRVTGTVIEVPVSDNQWVKAGDVLVRLDPRDYTVARDRAQATYDQAKLDFDRMEALKGDVAISKQDYDQSATNLRVMKAALDDAQNQLSYCTITAPTDGYIGSRTVETGNRVQVGGALMSVVQDIWVVANFKETQIGAMKRGQHVSITIDAVKGHKFSGWIDSLSPGTGATFALLPPDNATGNFTKIVQRVPVKIVFDPASLKSYDGRLVQGLSCQPVVDLSTPPETNLPPSP